DRRHRKKASGDSRIDSRKSRITETRSMNSAVDHKATPEFKDQFKAAVELKNQGRLGEAEQKFHDLLAMNPASASVHAFLSDTLWDQGRLIQAIASFRKAVELAPKSEMASLGLFHTLLESGDRAGAIAEMNRFLSLSDSEEYQNLGQQFGHEPSGS